jgi:hypothetical protein
VNVKSELRGGLDTYQNIPIQNKDITQSVRNRTLRWWDGDEEDVDGEKRRKFGRGAAFMALMPHHVYCNDYCMHLVNPTSVFNGVFFQSEKVPFLLLEDQVMVSLIFWSIITFLLHPYFPPLLADQPLIFFLSPFSPISLKALCENLRLPRLQIQQTLSKQPVRPTKPLPRPRSRIPRVDTLMYQSKLIRAADYFLQRSRDLAVVGRGEDAHDGGHWPGLTETCVWTTDTAIRQS